MKSSAYIRVKAYDYRYWFTGVTSVKHSFSLQVASTYDAGRRASSTAQRTSPTRSPSPWWRRTRASPAAPPE